MWSRRQLSLGYHNLARTVKFSGEVLDLKKKKKHCLGYLFKNRLLNEKTERGQGWGDERQQMQIIMG